ncbi:anaerobic ribonucleoside-triphosphate reductase activating protein [bacterium DOLZORAL124_64_63]|nr:MAG: anaerobic ribonucleoside-triphosphate reductase activating protein [bacterium DOLZORAL124_64_63]
MRHLRRGDGGLFPRGRVPASGEAVEPGQEEGIRSSRPVRWRHVLIGGWQKCSFIDYPGHLSAVVFLQGCNLRCPYCHNAELIPRGQGVLAAEEFLRFLGTRRNRLDGVVLSGGEPTLHRELPAFMEQIRAQGFAIKLDTNGTRPDVLRQLIARELVDYVAMDLKDEPGRYPRWLGPQADPAALRRSLDILQSSGLDHELRTTLVWPYHDPARLDAMAPWAQGCRRWVLQAYQENTKSPRVARFTPPPAGYVAAQATRIRERHGILCRARTEGNTITGKPGLAAMQGAAG